MKYLIGLIFLFLTVSVNAQLLGIASSAGNAGGSAGCGINLITYSEQLNVISGAWAQRSGMTVTTDQINDLEGNQTVELFTITSATNSLAWNGDDWLTVEPNTAYTVSFDFQRGTSTAANWAVADRSNGGYITSGVQESYYSLTSSTMSRIELSFTTPAGCTNIGLYFMKNGGTGTFYMGRAQLAPTGCTDYVETTTTKATGT